MSIISVLLIAKVGHSIGQHRYFSHNSFETGTKREWLLSLLSTLGTTHTPIYYSILHRFHHGNSDTGADPHSPSQIGFMRSFFSFIDNDKSHKIPIRIVKDLLKKKSVMFFHNWYWPTIIIYCILLILIDPYLFLFCYVLPVGYVQFSAGLQITITHTYGYKNFNTNDNSVNNTICNILTLGEGLHNNHHYKPNEYNFAFPQKKGEWDLSAFIIEKFLEKNNLRR
jgi:stearoyl-CoA desaturase (delta-9 desaturase)